MAVSGLKPLTHKVRDKGINNGGQEILLGIQQTTRFLTRGQVLGGQENEEANVSPVSSYCTHTQGTQLVSKKGKSIPFQWMLGRQVFHG